MRRIRRVLVASAVVAACGGEAETPRLEAVIDTVADTVVVRTLGGSVWGDTARLVEELRIGSLDGADEYVFGYPVSLAVGNGAVYLVDAQVPVVRAFDAETGEHLMDVGREGGGPGEYTSPDGVAVLPDGRILVRAPGLQGVNVYTSDGAFVERWPHPAPGFNTYDRFQVDTAGVAYATAILAGRVPWEWEMGFIGFTDGGEVTDTIPVAGRLSYERAYVTATGENSASRRPVPFTGDLVWSLGPAGDLAVGATSRYAVYRFDPDGSVLRIERDAEPLAVRPEEAEERRARITSGLQRQYGSWRWNGPEIPDTKPPLRGLFVDDDERIWVLVSQPGRPVMTREEAAAEEARTGRPVLRYLEPPAYDVFDRDGRFLGPVRVPEGLVVEDPHPVVRGDTVWALERDPLGVPTVVRYRLERAR